MNRRLLALSAWLVALSAATGVRARPLALSDYRIGDDLRTISEQSSTALPIARIIPHEPVVLQEREGRPAAEYRRIVRSPHEGTWSTQ